jgi:hypothetical protein
MPTNELPDIQGILDSGVNPTNFMDDTESPRNLTDLDAATVLSKDPEAALKNLQMNIARTTELKGGTDNLRLPKDSWLPQWRTYRDQYLEERNEVFKQIGFADKIAMALPEGAVEADEAIRAAPGDMLDAVANSSVGIGVVKGGAAFADAASNFVATLGVQVGKQLDSHFGDNRVSQTIYGVCMDAARDAQKFQRALGVHEDPMNIPAYLTEGVLQWYTGTKLLGALGGLLSLAPRVKLVSGSRWVLAQAVKAVRRAGPAFTSVVSHFIKNYPAYYLGHRIGVDPQRREGGEPSAKQLLSTLGLTQFKQLVEARKELLAIQEAQGDPHGRFSPEAKATAHLAAALGIAFDAAIIGGSKALKYVRGTKAAAIVPEPGAPGESPKAPSSDQGVPDATTGTPGAAAAVSEAVGTIGKAGASQVDELMAAVKRLEVPQAPKNLEIPGATPKEAPVAPGKPLAASVEAPKDVPTAAPDGTPPGAPEVEITSVPDESLDDFLAEQQLSMDTLNETAALTEKSFDDILKPLDDVTKRTADVVTEVAPMTAGEAPKVALKVTKGKTKAVKESVAPPTGSGMHYRHFSRSPLKLSDLLEESPESDTVFGPGLYLDTDSSWGDKRGISYHFQQPIDFSSKNSLRVSPAGGIPEYVALIRKSLTPTGTMSADKFKKNLLAAGYDALEISGFGPDGGEIMAQWTAKLDELVNPNGALFSDNLLQNQTVLYHPKSQVRTIGQATVTEFGEQVLKENKLLSSMRAPEWQGQGLGAVPIRAPKPPTEPGVPTIGLTKAEIDKAALGTYRGSQIVGEWVQGKTTPNESSFQLMAQNPLAEAIFTHVERKMSASGAAKAAVFKDAVLKRPELVPQLSIYDSISKRISEISKEFKANKRGRKGEASLGTMLEMFTGFSVGSGLAIYMDDEGLQGVMQNPKKLGFYVAGTFAALYGGRYAVESFGDWLSGAKAPLRDATKLTWAQEAAVNELASWKSELASELTRVTKITQTDITRATTSDIRVAMSKISRTIQLIPQMDDVALSELMAVSSFLPTPTSGITPGMALEPHPSIIDTVTQKAPMFLSPRTAGDYTDYIAHVSVRAQQAADDPSALLELSRQIPGTSKRLAGVTGETEATLAKRLTKDPAGHAKALGLIDQIDTNTSEMKKLLAVPAAQVDTEAVDLLLKETGIMREHLNGNFDAASKLFDTLPLIRNFSPDAIEFFKELANRNTAETFGRFCSLAASAEQVKALRTLWYVNVLSEPGTVYKTAINNTCGFMGENIKLFGQALVGVPQRMLQKLTRGKVDPNTMTMGDYFVSVGKLVGMWGDLGESFAEAWSSGIKRYSQTSAEAVSSKTSGMTHDWLPKLFRVDPGSPLYSAFAYTGDKTQSLLFNGLVALDEVVSAMTIKQNAIIESRKLMRQTKVPSGLDPRIFAEKLYYKVLGDQQFVTDQVRQTSVMTMNNGQFDTQLAQVLYDVAKNPAISVVSPFPKVAFNTTKYLVDHGLVSAGSTLKAAYQKGPLSPEFQKHSAKLGYAWMGILLGGYLESSGTLVIVDKDTPGTNRAVGLVSNSYLKLGKMQIPLAYLGPVAPLLLVGAGGKWGWTRYNQPDDEQSNWLGACFSAAQAAIEYAGDNSFTDNMQDLFSIPNKGFGPAKKLISRFISGFQPRIITTGERAYEQFTKSKDLTEFLFNTNAQAKTAVDLFDKSTFKQRYRTNLLNDPVYEANVILSLTPVSNEPIYKEFVATNFNDTPFVDARDSVFPGLMLPPGPVLEFKRKKTAEYIVENFSANIVGNEDYWRNPGVATNQKRRNMLRETVVTPALARAQVDTEMEFPDTYAEIRRLKAEMDLEAPQVDVRGQNMGIPSTRPTRERYQSTIERLMPKLESGGR